MPRWPQNRWARGLIGLVVCYATIHMVRSSGALSTSPDYCASSRKAEKPGYSDGVLINVLQVPNAGGATVRSMLQDWTRATPPRGARISYAYSDMSARCRNGERVVPTGIHVNHAGFGMGKNAPARRLDVVLAREPVERFLSWIKHVRAEGASPPEWARVTLAEALRLYRDERLHNPAALMSGSTSASNRFIHHGLFDQLATLASYECVEPAPAVDSSAAAAAGCARVVPYVFDEGVEDSDALCSVSSMRRMAMRNVRAADVVLTTDIVDGFRYVAHVHMDFIPWYASVRAHVERINHVVDSDWMALGARENEWLRGWLADEIDVVARARRIAASQYRQAVDCYVAARHNPRTDVVW